MLYYTVLCQCNCFFKRALWCCCHTLCSVQAVPILGKGLCCWQIPRLSRLAFAGLLSAMQGRIVQVRWWSWFPWRRVSWSWHVPLRTFPIRGETTFSADFLLVKGVYQIRFPEIWSHLCKHLDVRNTDFTVPPSSSRILSLIFWAVLSGVLNRWQLAVFLLKDIFVPLFTPLIECCWGDYKCF